MLILVTNDDGINAPGIKALSLALSTMGKVVVVAPERERSAIGHGVTMHKPLRTTAMAWEDPAITALAVNGTPADCVKLALDALLDAPPSLVVSGINNGENLGTDVFYSGTVSGALEGCINNCPSLAVSLVGDKDLDFDFAADFTVKLARQILKYGMPKGTLLNLNIPNLPLAKIKGLAVTRLGRRRYINTISSRKDPRGKTYYWLSGQKEDLIRSPDTDIGALNRDMISLTPMHLDLTDYSLQQKLDTYLASFWPDYN